MKITSPRSGIFEGVCDRIGIGRDLVLRRVRRATKKFEMDKARRFSFHVRYLLVLGTEKDRVFCIPGTQKTYV